jgi:hypothetical protein
MPPNHATKIVGSWDVKAITAKLAGLGARPRGFGKTTGLSFAADNQVNLDSKLTEQTQVSTDFDQMVVTDQQIATSPNSAALQKALDPGKALLDAAAYGKLAGCLGDVVAAIVMKPTGASHSTLVGVGVRDPASAAATQHEVLCIQPASGRQSSVHRAVQRSLAPAATDPTTRAPVSTHVAATQVHDASGLVQAVLTMQPDTQLGYLIDGLQRGSSRYWDGSCAVTSGAPRC